MTPTFITFIDEKGRQWEALALVAPLRSEDMDPVQFASSEDLKLKVRKIKVVRK